MQLAYSPAIALLGIFPREIKTYVYAKSQYTNAHSNIICNSQTLEPTQIYFNGDWSHKLK